jgi:uncharacterized protein DUF4349
MHLRLRRSRVRLIALGATIVVLGGVACSAASSFRLPTVAGSAPGTTSAVQTAGGPAPAAVPPAAAPMAGDAAQVARSAVPAQGANMAQSDTTVPDTSAQILDRMVIRNAQLTVEVPNNMEDAIAQVRAIANRDGGFVSASNTHFERVNDQDRMVADLTVQVRSDAADSALSDLRALGKVTGETSGSQDVTEEYVDLQSNLRNLQASESAVLKLMDRATQIQDVLSLQRELTNIRGQIERIQGRINYLEHRSDMATISVSLRLPPPPSVEPPAGAWDPVGVAQRGWQASLTLLRGVAEAVIVVVAFSWWLLPFIAVGAYVWLRRRRPTAAPASPAAPAA